MSGSGADIWNTADAFRFVYQPMTNNCDIRARVTSQTATDPWAKAGVMIRDSLDPSAADGIMPITPGNGFDFQYRSPGGTAAAGNISGGAINAAPNNWVRLTRTNTTFYAYISADGVTWTEVGSPTTLSLTNTVYYVGLAVCAHNAGLISTATFDNVTVNGFTYSNPPPAVALITPPPNSVYTAAASVTISADADALYDTISQVNFYANAAFLGSVSNLPYAVTATGLGAGGYALTAVAVSSSGLMSTSAPVNITVAAGSGQPYGLTSNRTVSAFLNMPADSTGSLPPLLSGTANLCEHNQPHAGQRIDSVCAERAAVEGQRRQQLVHGAAQQRWRRSRPANKFNFSRRIGGRSPPASVFVKNLDLTVNETNSTMRRLETQAAGARQQRLGLWRDLQMAAGQQRRRFAVQQPVRRHHDHQRHRRADADVVLSQSVGLPGMPQQRRRGKQLRHQRARRQRPAS